VNNLHLIGVELGSYSHRKKIMLVAWQ
jgi:hypothetical protein